MNQRRLFFPFPQAALAIACFLLASAYVQAQGRRESRTLGGAVYYAGGNQPAEHISVELRSNEGSLIAPQTTTSSGSFEFRGLEPSIYTIAIHADGFEEVNLNFDLNFNSSRGNVIYLQPTPKNSDRPSQAALVSAHELSMPQRARELMQVGKKKLYEEKDALGALADFEEAVAVAPGYYEAIYQTAMAHLTLGRREDAEKSFRRSIEVSKDAFGDAEIGLGTIMLDKGINPDGEKAIRRGLELSPDSWLGHYELGRALLNEGKIGEAKSSAERARSLAPSAPIVYRLLSNIHLREKDYSALLEDLDAYLKLDPSSPAGVRAKQLRDETQRKISERAKD